MLDDPINLIVGKPGIDDLELLLEYWEHNHISEAVAVAVGRLLLLISQVDDLPAEIRKLIEQRLLNVISFVELDVSGGFIRGSCAGLRSRKQGGHMALASE